MLGRGRYSEEQSISFGRIDSGVDMGCKDMGSNGLGGSWGIEGRTEDGGVSDWSCSGFRLMGVAEDDGTASC